MYFFIFKLQDMLSSSLNFKKSQSIYTYKRNAYKRDFRFRQTSHYFIPHKYTFHINFFCHITFSLFSQFLSTVVFRLLVTQVDNYL